MAKNSTPVAAVRKAATAKAHQPRPAQRIRKAPAPALGRKTERHAAPKSSPDHDARAGKTSEPNFTFYASPTLALVCVPSDTSALFSLDDAAHLTGVHPELLRYYSRVRLIESRQGFLDTDLFFDADALNEVRRIEHYRQSLGIGLRALPLICELRLAGERLQIELRFLSYPRAEQRS